MGYDLTLGPYLFIITWVLLSTKVEGWVDAVSATVRDGGHTARMEHEQEQESKVQPGSNLDPRAIHHDDTRSSISIHMYYDSHVTYMWPTDRGQKWWHLQLCMWDSSTGTHSSSAADRDRSAQPRHMHSSAMEMALPIDQSSGIRRSWSPRRSRLGKFMPMHWWDRQSKCAFLFCIVSISNRRGIITKRTEQNWSISDIGHSTVDIVSMWLGKLSMENMMDPIA